MSSTQEIVKEEPSEDQLPELVSGVDVPLSHPMATMLNAALYTNLKRAAATLSKSQFVPQRFRDHPEDVFVALHMSHRLGADPLLILQNLYVVHGEPGWKSQFVIAQANASGKLSDPIAFDTAGEGEGMSVTASATMKATGKTISATVDMKMAKAEGWTKNTKYQSMPEHMLCFRSAAFLVRRYLPEVMLGMQTMEELEDVAVAVPKDITDQVERVDGPALVDQVKRKSDVDGQEPDDAEQDAIDEAGARADVDDRLDEQRQEQNQAGEEGTEAPAEGEALELDGGNGEPDPNAPNLDEYKGAPGTKRLLDEAKEAKTAEDCDLLRSLNDKRNAAPGDKTKVQKAISKRFGELQGREQT